MVTRTHTETGRIRNTFEITVRHSTHSNARMREGGRGAAILLLCLCDTCQNVWQIVAIVVGDLIAAFGHFLCCCLCN